MSTSTSTLEQKKEADGNFVCINLSVSQEIANAIEEIAARKKISQAELLRKAVTLLAVVEDAKGRNERVGLFDSDRKITTEIVGV